MNTEHLRSEPSTLKPNGHLATFPRAIQVCALTDSPILAQGLTSIGMTLPQHIHLTSCISDLNVGSIPWGDGQPDIVLLDMGMGPEKILPWLRQGRSWMTFKVLLLSPHQDDALLEQALLAGAHGYLDHRSSRDVLQAAIEKIHQGDFWLEHTATARMLPKWIERVRAMPQDGLTLQLTQLTAREHKILCALITYDAEPAKAIAARLHISESTLRNHLTSIYNKMGVRNRHGLISLASRHGLTRRLTL